MTKLTETKSTETKSAITTHVLDTATGKPAANVPISLYKKVDNDWLFITDGKTDDDGRITDWINPDTKIEFAVYKLVFDLDSYFSDSYFLDSNVLDSNVLEPSAKGSAEPAFYPLAEICFRLQDNKHHHIPLLLSPFGYSTYRGS
jgi:hydroxyisourate hydrolase